MRKLVIVFGLLVAAIALLAWDRAQQWPSDECWSRGYSEVRYSAASMYCFKVEDGRTVILKLGRYKTADASPRP